MSLTCHLPSKLCAKFASTPFQAVESYTLLCSNLKNKQVYKYYSKMTILKFKKLSEHAFAPSKGSDKAAGYDLKSAHDCVVPKRGKMMVSTDLQIELPEGCYGRIAPRSGLAAKHCIDVGAGVIDEDYRGKVQVILFNFNDQDFEIKKGDRIAQLICEKIYYPELKEETELSDTVRGAGGFGSTGVN